MAHLHTRHLFQKYSTLVYSRLGRYPKNKLISVVVAELIQVGCPSVTQLTTSKHWRTTVFQSCCHYAAKTGQKPLPIKRSAQVQYNYYTTAIQEFFSCIAVVLHLCGPLQYNTVIQVFYNLLKKLQATCSSCKNLDCSCTALVRTTAIQQNFCVVIVVVL